MKKLMILMAAVATSAFALGDSLSNVFDATTASDLAGWTVPEGEDKAVLADKVLTLATGSDAASYLVNSGNPYAMGDNLYFDVSLDLLGQALDEVPTLPADAKLALFLLDTTEIDGAPTGTNLYALAKHPTESETILVELLADVETLTQKDEFTRLTVQTYKNVFKSGATPNSAFVVYQNGGETEGVSVDPVKLNRYYVFKDDGSINWNSPKSVDGAYLSGVLDAAVSGKRGSLLLSTKANVDGQSFTALDFAGNAKIQKVEINDSGFDFIAADVKVTTVTQEGVSIAVTPSDAYDAAKGTLSGDCTITVTLNPGMEVLTYSPMNSDYLTDNENGTFTYKYAEGNDVSFKAVAACAMVDNVPYATIGDALKALTTGGGGTLKLRRDLVVADLVAADITTGCLDLSGDIVLDLAGKNISLPGDETDNHGVVYLSEGSLKIINTDQAQVGRIKATVEGRPAVCCETGDVDEEGNRSAAIAIEAGIFEGSIRDIFLETADEEANQSSESDDETVTEPTVVKADVTGSITITGGSFSVEPDERLIAEGYVATQGEDGYWTVAQGEAPAEEDGTETNPYTISTVEDLQKVIVGADGAGKHYVLKNDLVLTKKWEGFGTYDNAANANAFEGVFDGKNHTISGVTFADNTSGNNYRGFFNQIHNATIKNLTVEGDGFGTDVPSGEYGCALLVGCANGSTIENCVAKGTIVSATHNVGGIAVRIKDTTIRNCTNEANLTGSYTKIGGIVVLNQGSTSACLIEGCVNKGTLTAAGNAENAGKDGLGGIVAYVGDDKLTIKDCTNEGALVKGEGAHASAKVGQVIGWALNAVAVSDAIAVRNDICTVGDGIVDGLNFATVADGVVTLVADSAAVAGASLKVMAADAPVTLAKGESITLDETLAKANITVPEDCEVKQDGNTYTATEKAEPPAVEPVSPGETTYETDAEAAEAAEAINANKAALIKVPAGVADTAAYVALFEATANGTTVTVDLTAAAKDDVQKQVDADLKAVDVAGIAAAEAEETELSITAEPGLYYSVKQGKTLSEMVEGSRQKVNTKGDVLKLKATKYSGSGFYRILVNTSDK